MIQSVVEEEKFHLQSFSSLQPFCRQKWNATKGVIIFYGSGGPKSGFGMRLKFHNPPC